MRAAVSVCIKETTAMLKKGAGIWELLSLFIK